MAAALLVPAQAQTQAQGKRPRMSEDLAQRVKEGDVAESRVIVTGTTAEVDAIVARHGLRVRQRLQTGAVVDVPAGALGAMADDTGIDHLAADQVVKSHMAVTNASIGADLVQIRRVGGRRAGADRGGCWRGGARLGRGERARAEGRVLAASTSPTTAVPGRITSATARTWRGSLPLPVPANDDDASAWRRGPQSST